MSLHFKHLIRESKTRIILTFILWLSLFFRLYGVMWDQGYHLHPDERFLTMVTADIKFPTSIANYFDSGTSVFNPDNNNYHFYVYGTLPLLITKVVAQVFHYPSYDQVYLVGRVLSAVFDSFTLILIYLIAFELFSKNSLALLASFIYATAVFPIQQSHFFTVDSFTVFFATWTLYLFIRYLNNQKISYLLISGFVFGLTLSSKTSIGITLPLILLIIALSRLKRPLTLAQIIDHTPDILVQIASFLFLVFAAFRIFQPYAFNSFLNLSPKFIDNVLTASKMITGSYDYPPNVQWTGTLPLFHPFINIFFFGLGPIISLLAIVGIFLVYSHRHYRLHLAWLSIAGYIGIIYLYQGTEWAKYMRYFYPLYPLFAIFAAVTLERLLSKVRNLQPIMLILLLLWPLAFLNIYTKDHTRVTASAWIFKNLPPGSKITNESWDDPLPLELPGYNMSTFSNTMLALYDPDTSKKWDTLTPQINSADYLMLTSNRLWGSIPRAATRYPISSTFYKNLFANNLNFHQLTKFVSYPGFQIPFLNSCYYLGPTNYPGVINRWSDVVKNCSAPGIYFRDDTAEESFTVYDHPQVIIFQKNSSPNLE